MAATEPNIVKLKKGALERLMCKMGHIDIDRRRVNNHKNINRKFLCAGAISVCVKQIINSSSVRGCVHYLEFLTAEILFKSSDLLNIF